MALVHGSEGNITRIDEESTAAYREGYGSREVARDRPSIAVFRGSRNGCVDRSSVLIELRHFQKKITDIFELALDGAMMSVWTESDEKTELRSIKTKILTVPVSRIKVRLLQPRSSPFTWMASRGASQKPSLLLFITVIRVLASYLVGSMPPNVTSPSFS